MGQPTRDLWVQPKYFELINNNKKTLEVRPAWPNLQDIQVGTLLRFNGDPQCERYVARVARYKTLYDIASYEDLSKVDPEKFVEELLWEGKRLFKPELHTFSGYLVFELSETMPKPEV